MLSFILFRHYCRNHSAYPPTSPPVNRENRTSRPSTLAYMAFQHARFTLPNSRLPEPWALTPRFHHHPPQSRERLWTKSAYSAGWRSRQTKAVIFCGTVCSPSLPTCNAGRKKTRLFTGTLPYAVQTFLPDQSQDDSPVCSCCKVS